jgi:fatty acid desaturase
MDKVKIPPALYRLNSIFFMRLLLIWGAIVTFCVSILVLGPGLLVPPVAIVLGLMYAHAVELQHWCLHELAFRIEPDSGLAKFLTRLGRARDSKRRHQLVSLLHRLVGILLGLPMLVAYSHYRAQHLEHHRWLGTPKDKEFFEYGRNFNSWSELLARAYSPRRFPHVFQEMWNALRGRTCADARSLKEARHIRQEYCLMAALLVAAGGLSLAWHSLVIFKVWVLPLLLSAEAAHYFIELPEHHGCETGTKDLRRNTRTIVGSWFSRWLTAYNNFHGEHHYHAGIPPARLADLHPLLAPQMVYVERSYGTFLKNTVRS